MFVVHHSVLENHSLFLRECIFTIMRTYRIQSVKDHRLPWIKVLATKEEVALWHENTQICVEMDMKFNIIVKVTLIMMMIALRIIIITNVQFQGKSMLDGSFIPNFASFVIITVEVSQ